MTAARLIELIESRFMRQQMQNCANIVQFPLDNLLKGELRGARGDLKRPFDRSCKEYDAKYGKLEKEKKAQAKEAGLIRSEITAAEVAEELDPERKMFQLQMCEVTFTVLYVVYGHTRWLSVYRLGTVHSRLTRRSALNYIFVDAPFNLMLD